MWLATNDRESLSLDDTTRECPPCAHAWLNSEFSKNVLPKSSRKTSRRKRVATRSGSGGAHVAFNTIIIYGRSFADKSRLEHVEKKQNLEHCVRRPRIVRILRMLLLCNTVFTKKSHEQRFIFNIRLYTVVGRLVRPVFNTPTDRPNSVPRKTPNSEHLNTYFIT